MTSLDEKAADPKLVAFTAPSAQVMAILDAAEAVRVRLLLAARRPGSSTAGSSACSPASCGRCGKRFAIQSSTAGCPAWLRRWG
jgi:hypothetical protein